MSVRAGWVSLVQVLENEDAVPLPFLAEPDWPSTSSLDYPPLEGENVPAGQLSPVQQLAMEDAVPLSFPAEPD